MKRNVSILLLAFLLVPGCLAAGKTREKSDKTKDGLLPASFHGWQKSASSVKASSDPAVADPTDSAILKEYGFSDVEQATYTRDDRKMQVKAARFKTASGAYGAFTFYVQPQMQTEKIPDEAASNNTRVLFFKGNILIDASLDRVTAMSAGDLRALSDALPRPTGDVGTLPSVLGNLPSQSYISHTKRYIVGPVAEERLGLPVPPALIDFSKSMGVVFGKYRSRMGEANLLIIDYPTPQIAAERMRAINDAHLPGGPFHFKRSGPLLAIVNGSAEENEAESLLASVNYDADVTWNQPTKHNPRDDAGAWLMAVIMLIGGIFLLSLIFGFAFGGVRVLAKKFFPDRFFDRPEDVEIIRLNLK